MPLDTSYGTEASVDVVIAAPNEPTVTAQVLDNVVTLRWTDSTSSLPIDFYEIRRGSDWDSGTVIGQKAGTFTTINETAAGDYTYRVAGVDTSGAYGTPGLVTVRVSQPSDYTTQLNQNSTFSGTRTNVALTDIGALANVDTTTTWQAHFTSRGWSSPQDQITAGFPYYSMPSTTSASYEETIDYGSVISSTKISPTLTYTNIAGDTSIVTTISTKKLVGDAWTDYVGVRDVYATDFRYAKIRFDFTSAGGDDLLSLDAFNLRFDSKLLNDSGRGTAVATDSGGTVVLFNNGFTRVTSITVTPATTSAVFATYSFTDTLNPTQFKVLMFDTSGARVGGNFGWSAKGV